MTDKEAIATLRTLQGDYIGGYISEALNIAIEVLKEKTKPFVTVANISVNERPHGEWKHAIVDCYKSGYICPHCNGFAVIDGKSDGYSVTFCPNCGSNNRPKEGEKK